MCRRVFILSAILLSLTFNARAQQSACSAADIPVSVIKANGDPVEGLTAADFSAQMKKQSLPVQSAAYEASPRRILVVLDETRELSAEGRKAEMAFATAVISSAQPQDSLALLTARGTAREVKFGADRGALLRALSENSEEQGRGKQFGVLDAVAEGITWFGEPQPGDAIVIIAMDLEGNHNTNPQKVAKLLEEHRIRLFGAAFGHLQLANQTRGTQGTSKDGLGYVDPGIPLWGQNGDANFLPLTVNSGGYVVPEDTLTKMHEFKFTDMKKMELEKTAAAMAGLIDKFYALHIANQSGAHAESWMISVNPGKLRGLPGAHVLYPHEIGPCR